MPSGEKVLSMSVQQISRAKDLGLVVLLGGRRIGSFQGSSLGESVLLEGSSLGESVLLEVCDSRNSAAAFGRYARWDDISASFLNEEVRHHPVGIGGEQCC